MRVNYLVEVGGLSTKDALNRFMRETIADKLCAQFTWKAKNKNSIIMKGTWFANLLFAALKQCRGIPLIYQAQFDLEVQNVLKVVKQRVRDSERGINCEEHASARHPRHHMETNFLIGAKKPDLPIGNSTEPNLHDRNSMEHDQFNQEHDLDDENCTELHLHDINTMLMNPYVRNENDMEPEVNGRNIIKLDPLEFHSEDFIQS